LQPMGLLVLMGHHQREASAQKGKGLPKSVSV
jgi:hypothetical protein